MASLNFKGKSIIQNYHLAVKYHELIPDKEKSLTDKVSLNDNLIIHGDNLKALKALLPTYAGKIKCIYIDPPYNTGNEGWKYNDNVNSPMMQEWLGKTVDRDDLTRHDKWLCMMMPRLKLLIELLREDGLIFISIDDNEVHHLKMILDEVIGENNFITNIIWQKKYTQSNDARFFSETHDYILCYGKNLDDSDLKIHTLERTEKQDSRYKNPDNDSRGAWKAIPLHAKSGNKREEITFINGKIWIPPPGTFNRYSLATIREAELDGRIYFGKNKNATPVMKLYLTNVGGLIPKTIWLYDEVGSNDDAKRELKDIFNDNIFDSPKPTTLIERIINLATKQEII
jgi:adenine-specific DNA-methyltransferase